MTHHPVDVILGIKVERGSFRTNLTDIFMIFLTMRLLPGTHGVTVVNAGTDQVYPVHIQEHPDERIHRLCQ